MLRFHAKNYRSRGLLVAALVSVVAILGIALVVINDSLPRLTFLGYKLNESSAQLMTFIEVEYVDPLLPERFRFKPKRFQLWFSGDRHLNLLEPPDPVTGIHSQFIFNDPQGWAINRFIKSAKEGSYPPAVCKSATIIFRDFNYSHLKDLVFGKEIVFFKDNGAQISESNGNRFYVLSKDGTELKLVTQLAVNSTRQDMLETPVSLEISANQRVSRVNYLQYLTKLVFDPLKFQPDGGFHISTVKPSLILSNDDSTKQAMIERQLAEKKRVFTHFYEDPSSLRLEELLESYEEFGTRLGIPNLGAYLGAIFDRYPAFVERLVSQGKKRKQDTKLEIYRGLQRCHSSLCKIILEQNPYGFNHEINQQFSKVQWPTWDRLELASMEGLTEYWSYFYVTGDERVLARIRAISESQVMCSGSLAGIKVDPALRRAFRRSLEEHASGHQKVARFL